uniref:Zinc finger protein 593 n=1 Tax=Athene cunicularia TaxID=194338 RepID=A0A663N8P3_ATHCN
MGQERFSPSQASELSTETPKHPPAPALLPHTRARPGQLASSPEHGLCSAVPALGRIRRSAPVFFPVGSGSWDAGEAGGCSALLSSCPWIVPAWAGRARCLLPACLAEGSTALAFPSAAAISATPDPHPLIPPTRRYFVDLTSMKEHFRSKVHKKRLKQLREAPYTQEEAERAAGMGSYILPKKVEVQTQPLEEVTEMEASS